MTKFLVIWGLLWMMVRIKSTFSAMFLIFPGVLKPTGWDRLSHSFLYEARPRARDKRQGNRLWRRNPETNG